MKNQDWQFPAGSRRLVQSIIYLKECLFYKVSKINFLEERALHFDFETIERKHTHMSSLISKYY